MLSQPFVRPLLDIQRPSPSRIEGIILTTYGQKLRQINETRYRALARGEFRALALRKTRQVWRQVALQQNREGLCEFFYRGPASLRVITRHPRAFAGQLATIYTERLLLRACANSPWYYGAHWLPDDNHLVEFVLVLPN
ncbi:MAG: hypothetical protein INF43_02965 [Alphaproteobacteria bacterium]|jgi:hypothetical protein|nr:hypothetical protein [Alphaproteobacteria bacterium]